MLLEEHKKYPLNCLEHRAEVLILACVCVSWSPGWLWRSGPGAAGGFAAPQTPLDADGACGSAHSRSGAQQDLRHVTDLMLLWDVLGLGKSLQEEEVTWDRQFPPSSSLSFI